MWQLTSNYPEVLVVDCTSQDQRGVLCKTNSNIYHVQGSSMKGKLDAAPGKYVSHIHLKCPYTAHILLLTIASFSLLNSFRDQMAWL